MTSLRKTNLVSSMDRIRPLLIAFVGTMLIAASAAHGEGRQTSGAAGRSIYDAVQFGTASDVREILRSAPLERDARNAHGSQPIHIAAGNSDPGPLKALLAAGANPNARDVDGVTPLHMAALARNAENARLLLEAGADPKAKDNLGHDALAIAHEVLANEVAGIVSLWILKGCQPKRPC